MPLERTRTAFPVPAAISLSKTNKKISDENKVYNFKKIEGGGGLT